MSIFDKAKALAAAKVSAAKTKLKSEFDRRLREMIEKNHREMERWLVVEEDVATLHCRGCESERRISTDQVGKIVQCGCGHETDTSQFIIDVDPRALYKIKDGFSGPLLVDVFAPWCGPCFMVMPNVVKLASTSRGRFLVLRLNGDKYDDIAIRWEVRAFPTMVRLEGDAMETAVGGKTFEEMVAFANA